MMTPKRKTIREDVLKQISEMKEFFQNTSHLMQRTNHQEHNSNPEYWDILLGDIKADPARWEGKIAFDFGCGCGRNLTNLKSLADFARVDGVDISLNNVEFSRKHVETVRPDIPSVIEESDGASIGMPRDNYDFIMSTIVMQHIPWYSVRYNILVDMFEMCRSGGLVSVQYADMSSAVRYHQELAPKVPFNCRVSDQNFLRRDLEEVGFINVSIVESAFHGVKWYYVKAEKP